MSDRSAVVVLTVRTIQIPDKAYSAALRNAEGITENYLRDQYGVDVDVRFSGESHTTVEGHDAVRQDYGVYKTGPLGTQTLLVAKMSVLAWFCNENFISVAAGFFHGAAANPDIAGNLQCH
jgi:ABC-type phosphate/phosphonate transport system substrate-binding protein